MRILGFFCIAVGAIAAGAITNWPLWQTVIAIGVSSIIWHGISKEV